MTAITDAMGLTLPGASSIPAVDSGHQRMSAACGRRIVGMVWEDLTPEKIVTSAAVRNAAIVAMATGCSTNAVVHLIAMARRAGVDAERPYTDDALAAVAARCTERENAARKVERLTRKQAAAALLAPRVGETFRAVVTGAKREGTYVRLADPPVEGRVVHGAAGLDVGDATRVRLASVDPARGWVDFERA